MRSIKTIPVFGDHNDDVRTIQEVLSEQKYLPIMVDGIFGNQTRLRIAKFQKDNALINSGIINIETLNKLDITIEKSISDTGAITLSWERNHPERSEWTTIAINSITKHFDKAFALCTDITNFRTDYNTLTQTQKIVVWGELISAVAKFESDWKLNSWMIETTMKNDPITKRQVRSEGLLQLSYQDSLNYSKLKCNFNWEIDKMLNDNDLNKTIFNAFNNLDFGIQILAKQIAEQRLIAATKNVYWSVLKPNGKYNKLTQIASMVNNLKF